MGRSQPDLAGNSGTQDARAPTTLPHLLSQPVFLLPAKAVQRFFRNGLMGEPPNSRQLPQVAAVSLAPGADPGAMGLQPLWFPPLQGFFQNLYRKGLGRPLQRDSRHLGRPADQGLVAAVGSAARIQQRR